MIACIGQVDERLGKVSALLECFDPIWPKYAEWTISLMQRICVAILPEVSSDRALQQSVRDLLAKRYNNNPPILVQRDPYLLSQELLVLIYLTMLGFTFPVKQGYNPKLDRMKPWARELMLRIVKGHGPPTRFEY